MSGAFVITGTDTDIGKSVFAAALTAALDASYWKPVQAGLAEGTDSETVARIGGVDPARILPERYRLKTPRLAAFFGSAGRHCHWSGRSRRPASRGPADYRGRGRRAGPSQSGIAVRRSLCPLGPAGDHRCVDQSRDHQPHSLLTIEALRSRGVPIHGIAFIGAENVDSEQTICRIGAVRHLGRLPMIDELAPEPLREAFAAHFNIADFLS